MLTLLDASQYMFAGKYQVGVALVPSSAMANFTAGIAKESLRKLRGNAKVIICWFVVLLRFINILYNEAIVVPFEEEGFILQLSSAKSDYIWIKAFQMYWNLNHELENSFIEHTH